MSERTKAKAARRLTGDSYQKCLQWLRDNQDKVHGYLQLNEHSGLSQTEAAARCYEYYRQLEKAP